MISPSEISYLRQKECKVDLVSLEFQLINNEHHFFCTFYYNEVWTRLPYMGQEKGVKSNNLSGFEPVTFKLLDLALTKVRLGQVSSLGGHIGNAFGQLVPVI